MKKKFDAIPEGHKFGFGSLMATASFIFMALFSAYYHKIANYEYDCCAVKIVDSDEWLSAKCSEVDELPDTYDSVRDVSEEFAMVCLFGVIFFLLQAFASIMMMFKWTQIVSVISYCFTTWTGLMWFLAANVITYRPEGVVCYTTESSDFN